MSVMGDKLLNETFLRLFLEKNSDDTMHLRLKGKELYQRFGSRLKPRHMRTIATFLLNNPDIVSVDLCYNDFGDRGLETLSEYLFNHPNNLQSMSLMQCDITAKGIEKLSASSHIRLKMCRLNGNKIGAEGARFIARLIENCPYLEILDIAETDQTLESIESFLIVIEESNIKVLDISRIIQNSFYTKYNQATLADDLGVALKRLARMIRSGVIEQEYIDVKTYILDGKIQAVHYPANTYKANYYSLMKFGYPETLKIKRNIIDGPLDQPRALLNLTHIGRYPKVDKSLGPRVVRIPKCKDDEEKNVMEEAEAIQESGME
ncbi:unnamed protein product [Psylliodes chrysocephalus]|uniref:Uncharacterized protein n=1 Tax=Psylliodes chrysocephalus TaxID=3402493 RepID=A0A9P0CPC7_9CUCU|nr:unnamed protein product [Psylliodes chrysocephala]